VKRSVVAKINLYIPGELKVRMDAVDNINWSDVALPAFYSALATLEHRRNPSMSAVIERLRASKAESLNLALAN
jgi:hypothetical protein